MSNAMHVHVVDGKQMYFPNNSCPICGTLQVPQAKKAFVPNVHRKGNTIVYQATRLQMMTTTWYQKEQVFLLSLRKAQRDSKGVVIRQNDGKPVWNQITIRINIPMLKQLVAEYEKFIKELETTPTYVQPEVPKRG